MTYEVTVEVNDDIEVSQDHHQDQGQHQDPIQIADLDGDPDTSLARSVRLHLLSEHQLMGALHMDEADAEARHGELHLQSPQDHPVDDLRFRPGLVLKCLLLRCEQLQRLLVPAQPTRV